jgi:prepilin-type processing-associated H-X9-DG protein
MFPIPYCYIKAGKIMVAETFGFEEIIFYPCNKDTGLPRTTTSGGPYNNSVVLRHGDGNRVNTKRTGANYLFGDSHVEYSTEYHKAIAPSLSSSFSNATAYKQNYIRWWDHGTKADFY